MRRCIGCGKVMKADQSFTRINGVVFCDTDCWKEWRETNKRLSFAADPFRPGLNYEPPQCGDESTCATSNCIWPRPALPEMYFIKEPQKVPLILSQDEARRLLAMSDNVRNRLLLSARVA